MGFRFERNIVHFDGRTPLTQGGGNKVAFAANLYSGGVTEAGFRVGEQTWEDWRAGGQDRGSRITSDEVFADPSKDDFALRARSVAREMGLASIDVGKAGPRR
jgi:hypothetical protein